VEWLYEERVPSSKPELSEIEVLPPRAELEQLLDWAKGGRILEIRDWAAQARSGNYAEVAARLGQLAKEFEIKAIRMCLRQWLTED